MKKVFLIDDDVFFVSLVKKLLETVDPTVMIDIFADGELAIDHLSSCKGTVGLLPDIIFLDLNMPVLDGWGFLDQYSILHPEVQKKVAIYILSSGISPDEIARACDHPLVSEYLVKPLDRSKAIEILSKT